MRDFNSISTNGKDVEGTIFHTPCDKCAAGLRFTWKGAETGFEVAGKYAVDEKTVVKAKINKSLLLGLSFSHKLSSSAAVTLSASVNAANLNGAGHSVGLALTLEQ